MDKNYKNEGPVGTAVSTPRAVAKSGTQVSSEDKNQMLFDPRYGGQYMAVDLSEMFNQQNYEFAESIVADKEP